MGAIRYHIPRSECIERLAAESVGRLCFIDHGYPLAFPVNYRLVDPRRADRIVFRTSSTALLAALRGSFVARGRSDQSPQPRGVECRRARSAPPRPRRAGSSRYRAVGRWRTKPVVDPRCRGDHWSAVRRSDDRGSDPRRLAAARRLTRWRRTHASVRSPIAAGADRRRPLNSSGVRATNALTSGAEPGAAAFDQLGSAAARQRSASAGSVTARSWPIAETLQPAVICSSSQSASKHTT